MTNWEPKYIMDDISKFIQECPLIKESTYIDKPDVQIDFFEPGNNGGDLALAYNGNVYLYDQGDILNGKSIRKQANFIFQIKWNIRDSFNRLNANDFLFNFHNWVETQNYNNEVPRIGDNPSTNNERMWSDNGAFFSKKDDETNVGIYQIQLHIIYTKEYR